MFESVLEWVVIGLVLVNLIALNNWHRIMHKKIEEMAVAINFILVVSMIEKKMSKSSDKTDIKNAIQIMKWDMGDGEDL